MNLASVLLVSKSRSCSVPRLSRAVVTWTYAFFAAGCGQDPGGSTDTANDPDPVMPPPSRQLDCLEIEELVSACNYKTTYDTNTNLAAACPIDSSYASAVHLGRAVRSN